MEKTISKKPVSWQKPLGFVLLTFFIVMILQWIFADYYQGKGKTIIIFWIFGGLLGYLLSRCRFGFLGPIKRLVNNGDGRQARAMILMMSMSTIIAGAIIAGFGSSLDKTGGIGLGVMLGGFIFGLAMVFAGGCASGILTDSGKGTLGAFIVVIFFSLGAVVGGILGVYTGKLDFMKGDSTNFANISKDYGWIIGILINLFLFSLLLVAIKMIEIKKQKNGGFYIKQPVKDATEAKVEVEEVSMWKNLYHKVFVDQFNWTIGALLLAIWFGAYVSASKGTNGVAGGYTHWGGWLLWLFGYHALATSGLVIDGKTVLSADAISAGPLKHGGAMFVLAIIIGATFYFLSSNKFKIGLPKKWWDPIVLAVAGFVLGIGAKIAGGCNLGHTWFGIATFKLSSWFFTFFMVLGVVLANYIRKKIVKACQKE